MRLRNRKAAKLKAIYEKTNDPAVFVEKANKLELGFMLAYESEAFYLIYPTMTTFYWFFTET